MSNEASMIVITGATDGIGLELARLHHRRRDRLLLVGRRPLSSLDDPVVSQNYVRTDLSQPQSVEALLEELERRGSPSIQRLYLNAGVGAFGLFERESVESIREMIRVNVLTPIEWTRRLLSRLAPGAGIVFVSSVAQDMPCPDYAAYAATKAAIDTFGRELAAELQFDRRDLRITIARPGATRTGMQEKSRLPRERVDWTRFPPASRVARSIAFAADRARPAHAPGVANRALLAVSRWWPSLLDRAAIKSFRRDHGRLRRLSTALRPGPCVITGFAHGIGLALARRFAAAGHPIIGVDHDETASSRVVSELRRQKVPAWGVIADLATREGCARAVAELRRIERPQLFIHNAGINAFGRFSESTLSEQEQVVALNLEAPLLLTQELLRSGWAVDAHWVFISSLSKHIGYPGAAVYAATKAGLASFGRSLGATGRRTLTVFPGPTRTEHARHYSPDNSRESAHMGPEQLASRIFLAVRAGRARLIPGGTSRLFAVAGLFAPSWTRRVLAKSLLGERLDRASPAGKSEAQ